MRARHTSKWWAALRRTEAPSRRVAGAQLRSAALLLAGAWLATPTQASEMSAARADQLKAAYLFNFLKFVDSPTLTADGSIVICFVDASGVQKMLEASPSAQRLVDKPVVVHSLHADDSPAHCALVYFSSAAAVEHPTLLQRAQTSSLTVSDDEKFTRRGGVIQLFTESNRLRFVINTENAKHSNLRISSNLLKLASRVEQSRAPMR